MYAGARTFATLHKNLCTKGGAIQTRALVNAIKLVSGWYWEHPPNGISLLFVGDY